MLVIRLRHCIISVLRWSIFLFQDNCSLNAHLCQDNNTTRTSIDFPSGTEFDGLRRAIQSYQTAYTGFRVKSVVKGTINI